MLHLYLLIIQRPCMKHQTLLQPTWVSVCVYVVLPAEHHLFACFIWRNNNVRNAFARQWRRYRSIAGLAAAAARPRLPLFGWFKVWNTTPVQSTVWACHHMVWTLKSNLILSKPALATKWVPITLPEDRQLCVTAFYIILLDLNEAFISMHSVFLTQCTCS